MTTDYFMRQIEEFFRGLYRILHLKEINQFENALDELNNLTKMMVGFDLNQLKLFGIDGVLDLFNLNNISNIEKIYYSAMALKEEGMIFILQGRKDEAREDVELALKLFEILKEQNKTDIPDIDKEISFLKEKIN